VLDLMLPDLAGDEVVPAGAAVDHGADRDVQDTNNAIRAGLACDARWRRPAPPRSRPGGLPASPSRRRSAPASASGPAWLLFYSRLPW